MPNNMYIYTAKKEHFDLPCFFEIKRTEKDEFINRSGLIDQRDINDKNTIDPVLHVAVSSEYIY